MTDADAILVLGHGGLLGRAVVYAAQGKCWVVQGGRNAFDLERPAEMDPLKPFEPALDSPTDPKGAKTSLRFLESRLALDKQSLDTMHHGLDLLQTFIKRNKPACVINCAGYTDVDKAESEPKKAIAINAKGPGEIARACASAGSHLIHISTDYVFDGKIKRPYRELDTVRPETAYGLSKLEGERLVLEALPNALIVRSAWIFGPGRPGFVDNIIEKVKQGQRPLVVKDEIGSPTYSLDLAKALVFLARKKISGILHVVNQGQASRYELARQACRLAGFDPNIVKPASRSEIYRPAQRPAYSVLDTRRYSRITGQTMPSWLDALGRYIALTKED